jgi:hypothetical protein
VYHRRPCKNKKATRRHSKISTTRRDASRRPGIPPAAQRFAGQNPQIKALPSLESAFLLCGGGHSTEFPLLLGSASIVSNSVIDLQDKTYCIIVHIHFVGAPAVVALSLEKGRTSLRFAK